MKHRRIVKVAAVLAVVLGLAVGVATPVVASGLSELEPQPIGWSNLLQVTLQGMLAAALPIVVAFGVGWLKAKTNEVLSGVDAQTRWLIESAASAAVLAGAADSSQRDISGLRVLLAQRPCTADAMADDQRKGSQ